jgi:hypothetical protein
VNVGADGLSGASTFTVPGTIVAETIAVMQEAGAGGFEAFVIWGGRWSAPDTIGVTTAYLPTQTPHQTPEGLAVTLDGDALFAANMSMYQRDEILVAQVHSHPTDAFHSELDDAMPIVTMRGALSGVVPDFGADGPDGFTTWAWYRLTAPGRFDEAAPGTVQVAP